jgi:hypothetical protein
MGRLQKYGVYPYAVSKWYRGLTISSPDRSPIQLYHGTTPPDSTVYNDYLVGGLTVTRGNSAPDLVELRDNIELYGFAGTGLTVEQVYFSIHILHDYLLGQRPTLHIHWVHNNASPSGSVKWQVDLTVSKGYSQGIFDTPITYSVVQEAGAQYTHHITDDDSMVLNAAQSAMLEPDSILVGRLYRDPADAEDTFEDDAMLVNMDLHYQIGQVGTLERNATWDSIQNDNSQV